MKTIDKDVWKWGFNPVETGKRIREERRLNNLTQRGLVDLFYQAGEDITEAAISSWERGKKVPTLDHLIFLSILFESPLDGLVRTYLCSEDTEERDEPVPYIQPYSDFQTDIRCGGFFFAFFQGGSAVLASFPFYKPQVFFFGRPL